MATAVTEGKSESAFTPVEPRKTRGTEPRDALKRLRQPQFQVF